MSKRPSSGSEGQTTPPRNARNVIWWEEARLKQALPRVIGRCMSFSAATCFDDALVGAVRRFYGIEVDVATAETDILEDDFERVRFFPWFLWDFVAAESALTVGEHFLVETDLGDLERRLVAALVDSCVTFVEVLDVDPTDGLLALRDLRERDEVVVRDFGLASELATGQISLMRLVRVPDVDVPRAAGASALAARATFAMIDAIYAVLPPEARPMVAAELPRLLGTGSLKRAKELAPELLDFAEDVLHRLTEPPTLVNVDDEPIVLCRTFVGGTATAALEQALVSGPFAPTPEAPGSSWLWHETGRTIGWVRRVDGGLVIESGSRERLGRIKVALADLGVTLPPLHSEVELGRAVAEWLAMGECEAWLTDGEVESAFRGSLGEWLHQWPDQPHPALGRRTPREVKGEPGGDAVVARLLQRVRKVAGEAAGAELASLLA